MKKRPGSAVSTSRKLSVDPAARSATPGEPAFAARPPGSPIYHGFIVVPETYIDGWVLGEITEYLDNEDGDGFVVAPDGTRAGLVWEVREDGDGVEPQEIIPPNQERWGVYAIAFPRRMRTMADVVANFRSVLPTLRQLHSRIPR